MADINVSTKYILTNDATGSSKSLASTSLNDSLIIAPLQDDIGDDQLWTFTATDIKDRYRLSTVAKNEFHAIDISFYNPEKTMTVHFVSVENNTGQYWGFSEWKDGSIKITNDFSGPDMSLNVDTTSLKVNMAGGDNPGQHWTLNPSGSITASVTGTASTTASRATNSAETTETADSALSSCAPSATACSTIPATSKDNGLSKGGIAGAAVGGAAGLALLVLLALALKRYCGPIRRGLPVMGNDG